MTFRATGRTGTPIYHTNVMMAVGSTYAIVCAESVEDPAERQRLLQTLGRSHKACPLHRQYMTPGCSYHSLVMLLCAWPAAQLCSSEPGWSCAGRTKPMMLCCGCPL